MTDYGAPMEFTFNYGSWPFVEIGDSDGPGIEDVLDPQLVADIKHWNTVFQENYGQDMGFEDSEIEKWINVEYKNLCSRLVKAGLPILVCHWWMCSPARYGYECQPRCSLRRQNLAN